MESILASNLGGQDPYYQKFSVFLLSLPRIPLQFQREYRHCQHRLRHTGADFCADVSAELPQVALSAVPKGSLGVFLSLSATPCSSFWLRALKRCRNSRLIATCLFVNFDFTCTGLSGSNNARYRSKLT
ncbi:hypothetical protein L596_025988 [Steinernema carpocapsae]|uniref:Uncharacterized protein n=1 Tax=Steinernema carpocapsae TaxID=34508 RepID=A0A4U5M104_STECR|nr:hypothetical protein L596_025988 [Steinernema carpocapsae]